jgi:hypothetical protein
MAISKEWWDFHLTPSGWVQGSYQLERGDEQKLEVPGDVILTRRFSEQISEPLSPGRRTYVDLDVKDEALAGELLHQYPYPWKFYASFRYANDN